jgi:hypothetical protein
MAFFGLPDMGNPFNTGTFGGAGGGGGSFGEGGATNDILQQALASINANPQGTMVSPTSNPDFAQLLLNAQQSMPQNLPSLQQIVSQGANSPLMEAILGPALQRLQAPQAQQRQGLLDTFRAAGGQRSGAFGRATTDLAGQQGLQQNDLISSVLAKTLGTLVPGQLQENQQAYNPISALTQILQASRPQVVPNADPAKAYTDLLSILSRSQGGGGGGGGGSVSIGQQGNPLAFSGSGNTAAPGYRRSSPNSNFAGPSSFVDVPSTGGFDFGSNYNYEPLGGYDATNGEY